MDFDEVVERFIRATTAVADEYFLLKVAGGGGPVWRERVYCYELYHQLRINWGDKLMLAAEVDKRSHPLPHFRIDELRDVKPDFIVHDAGHEHDDVAVIEVKRAISKSQKITDDYLTLMNFCHRARYKGGIMLFFGINRRLSTKAARALDAARENAGFVCDKPLVTLHHAAPGQPAVRIP